MASISEAQEVLLNLIVTKASEYNAGAVKDLAEAYAWLKSPGQSHGGSTVVKTG